MLAAWLAVIVFSRAVELPFDDQWRFVRDDVSAASAPDFDDQAWEVVTLPHTPRIEALPAGKDARQWQGICWYRKTFALPASAADKSILLRFDGAMNVAEFWVNGQPAGKFMGGYLPYVLDISRLARAGETNVITVRLDNRDNPITGPKPLADLDFNLYGGLYRSAHLIIQDKLHISDAILADKVAGGGIFVTYPMVTPTESLVDVKVHIQNQDAIPRMFTLRTTLRDADGRIVASIDSAAIDHKFTLRTTSRDADGRIVGSIDSAGTELAAGADCELTSELTVPNPKLWSPSSPNLYRLSAEVIGKDGTVDAQQVRIGLRRIEITKDGLVINGRKTFLTGANRHQEYPYIGNALSDAAQYRDARKIKEGGFDFVRCSHYPPSPAFLDACDELGIVVMDSLFGWQYFNHDPAFAVEKERESRQMIRRDRNHACIALWEVSLNESDMPRSFIRHEKAVAHEEYPGDQCYTAGWEPGYDVFIQARQHGGCHNYTNGPCLISEYGDWEYYAQNAGFAQDKWQDLKPAERSSRQARGDGDVRQLQQAANFQEAHNDNLSTPAFADAIWCMFDYNRGYAPDLETSGVMDTFRLPKFSWWFFRSQRDADEPVAGQKTGPLVFIANDWATNSPLDVRVFSNCEEVALYLNGRLIARQRPDASRLSTHLKHPPFIFHLPSFEAGGLRAVGYVGDHAVVTDERRTPGEATQLALDFDLGGQPFAAHGKDVVFCRATLDDSDGTPTQANDQSVYFGATGSLKMASPLAAHAEAGTASGIVEADAARATGAVYAICVVKGPDRMRILAAGASPDGRSVPAGEIRYTLDGTVPTLTSPLYSAPVADPPQLHAALYVGDKLVAVSQ